MKRHLIPFLLCLALMFTGLSLDFAKINDRNSTALVEDFSKCKYGQCEAIAKSTKKRCKHCVSNKGDNYCWQHK